MRRIPILLLAFAAAAAPSPALAADNDAKPAVKRVCLSQAETREQIKLLRLHEPYSALRAAAQHYKAEALSAKLCRIDDDLVYEISLLHRDGKFIHAHVDAVSGKLVEAKRVTAAAPAAKN